MRGGPTASVHLGKERLDMYTAEVDMTKVDGGDGGYSTTRQNYLRLQKHPTVHLLPKMRKSAAEASLDNCQKNWRKDVSCHAKSGSLGFEPKGPPEDEKMEESASHHFNYIFCAAARRNC